MALITCPECNQSISSTAHKCPHCGYRLKKTISKKQWLITGTVIASAALLVLIFYFLILIPQQLPGKASALVETGNFVEAE